MAALKKAIAAEREKRLAFEWDKLIDWIEVGEGQRALEAVVFFAAPSGAEDGLRDLLAQVETLAADGNDDVRARCLVFLADLVLMLRSFLPRWALQNRDLYGDEALTAKQVNDLADATQVAALDLAGQFPSLEERLIERRRDQVEARYAAEDAGDPSAEARQLVGGCLEDYLINAAAETGRSNLRRIAEMRDAGDTLTELSNDYAAFLPTMLYVGASFATTNPPLVDMAWLADRARWDPVVDSIVAANPDLDADGLARLVTLEVVLDNMRLLRPIFLLTEGDMGCVCLQVNPHLHGDAAAMVADARFFYDTLRERFDGGVPNVVFKLPGTLAGLEACRALTEEGIGVTITVNFGLFQHTRFADAMAGGEAIFSCLVEMNGRLAYPVRDELLAKLDALATKGIDEASAREAAAWSGVAVVKRVHRLWEEQGRDLGRFKPLIASLRVYEGEGYDGLPSAFPDMTEILGTSLLSVFPNVRRAFDAGPGLELEPERIAEPVPDEALRVLQHSEIFKQAYYVADTEWVGEEDERFRPDRELALEDEEAVFAWPPVHATLTQFMDAYDGFVDRIMERR